MYTLNHIVPLFTNLYSSVDTAGLALFRGIFGDFDYEFHDNDGNANTNLIWAAYLFVIIYLIVASLILLNILIAMMAVKYHKIKKYPEKSFFV